MKDIEVTFSKESGGFPLIKLESEDVSFDIPKQAALNRSATA